MKKYFTLAALALMLLITSSASIPQSTGPRASHQNLQHFPNPSPPLEPLKGEIVSEHVPLVGILQPIEIERRGYSSSGTLSARTDISPIIGYDLPLDDDHDWVGSQAEVNITNLERLYAVNGTFDSGVPGQNILDPATTINYYPYGWNATAYSPSGGQVQVASYDNTGTKYIAVENQGLKIGPSGKQYDHVAGTEIVWYQILENEPYTENFYLSCDYYYLRGPLGDGVTGEGRFFVAVDGTVIWNTSIPDLPSRTTWYSVDDLSVTLSSPGSALNFSIGFIVDSTFDLNADEDNDGDGYVDGIANTAYLTAWFDDVSFVGQNAPAFDAVDMQFSAGASSTPITGSMGNGTATIANATNWNTSPVPITITSNTSVSFNYVTRLLSHNYRDSNSDTSPLKLGVNYYIGVDESSELSFYTYLGSLGDYEELTIIAVYPNDWDNITVYEPQSDDVTGQCIISQGTVTIPTSLLVGGLGWWFFTIQSPNYADFLTTQVYDSGGDQWNAETVFRSGNKSRVSATLGSGLNIPDPLNLVNVTWFMPNGTIWHQESVSGGVAGTITSSGLTMGATNTSAGEWYILVAWQNGTEIAYGESSFEVHHSTSLYPAKAVIETDAGLNATVFVIYKDTENNDILMEDTALITANWSASTIVFRPNDNRNQWEADFNTAALGPGEYLVVVNASRPYFDDASCTFLIQSVGTDNDLLIGSPFIIMSLYQTFTAEVRFTDQYGAAILGADINVEIEPLTGLSWGNVVDLGNGNYTFDLYSAASGTYSLTVSASKSYYDAAYARFIVDVGEIATNLEGLSADSVEFTNSYNLTIRYTNGTGFGIAGANVRNVSQSSGLTVEATYDLGDGYYSIILTPEESGTFTIFIEVSRENHQTQYHQFTLFTRPISSQLTYSATASTISIDQTCTVTFNFTSSLMGGIEGATISIIGSYPGLSFSPVQEIGGGLYSIVITPNDVGTYYIAFYASAENHANSTAFFPLIVVPVQTNLRSSGGISSAIANYSEIYQLMVLYERESPSANITGAAIEVFFDGLETLDWSVSSMSNGYLISFTANVLGRWGMTITANATGYELSSMRFVLVVAQLDTELTGTNPSTLMYYGRTYIFSYVYRLASNGTGISGAENATAGIDPHWLVFDDLENGSYIIYLTPKQIGSYSMKVSLQIYGMQQRTIEFEFEVENIPLHIEASSIIYNWNHDLFITITLTNGFNELVSDATVAYHLLHRDVEVEWGIMEMTSSGVYIASLRPRWYGDNSYEVRITVDLDNHVLAEPFVAPIAEQILASDYPMYMFLLYGIPASAVVGVLVLALISYRTYSTRKRREYVEALEVKRRFDDINNLLGIIILHAKSGLPIYSNVLKGGFEEGMISAFITAITHFRQEFVPNGEDDMTYDIIPISDIIRAVPTRNLVCAFITVSKASAFQEDKMIEFAKEIGKLFDDVLEDRPREFRDETMALTIQMAFENTLDGYLLKYYKRATAAKFPRKLAPLEEAMTGSDLFECASAQALANSMFGQGIDEARGCSIVYQAIEKEYLTPCDKHEVHMHKELDWQLFNGADQM
ncbi:MAG: carboxypeptidase-like regulatory domain-containing protein [Promethearchaeota archaeon]